MDILVFKYITTVFALTSVMFVVIIKKYSTTKCTKYFKASSRVQQKTDKKNSSVTHGISTFLIICYGQCTRTGLSILTITYLKGRFGMKFIPVTYFGGLDYFGKQHLPYAIPAIIFSSLLMILPPLLLFMYPLILHLLSFCGLSEHPLVSKCLHCIGINKFMPLFDSLQSCYKDRMRFFSGLYLFYRVVAFITYLNSDVVPLVFLAILLLGIHSIFHPYTSWKNNLIDSFIFLNLSAISSITVMIKHSLLQESTINNNIFVLSVVQVALIYLPLITLIFMMTISFIRKKLQNKQIQASSPECRLTLTHNITHTSIELKQALICDD